MDLDQFPCWLPPGRVFGVRHAFGCSLLVCFPIEKGLYSISAQFYSLSLVAVVSVGKLTKYRKAGGDELRERG